MKVTVTTISSKRTTSWKRCYRTGFREQRHLRSKLERRPRKLQTCPRYLTKTPISSSKKWMQLNAFPSFNLKRFLTHIAAITNANSRLSQQLQSREEPILFQEKLMSRTSLRSARMLIKSKSLPRASSPREMTQMRHFYLAGKSDIWMFEVNNYVNITDE